MMEFVSILDYKGNPVMEDGMPEFFVDLNLDQVLNQIQGSIRVPVKKYYYYFPADKECEEYRRRVYCDVKREEIYDGLASFVKHMEERKQARDKKLAVSLGVQLGAWHMLEAATYCEACAHLYKALSGAELQSEGLLAFLDYLKAYVSSEGFVRMQEKAFDLRERLQSFRVKLVYENEQLLVEEGAVSGSYEKFLQDALNVCPGQMQSPFSVDVDLDDLEDEIIHKFARKQEAFFKETREFYHTYKEYEEQRVVCFSEEINFYLSYAAFQRRMEREGLCFATPSADEDKDMSAYGLYDLALACNNIKNGRKVVSNEIYLGKEEQFIVLTGPNQGGKTTFARSLGQLVYLSKMGLDVPATAANVHWFSDILTHFSVEESVETGRGKLMEELMRLKPMMSGACKKAFVVINELFTTAANYDACIMGKKVLNHFIKLDCVGIYVTHLKELTEAHERIVSMRAMMDEQKVQNFKICRKAADDSVCAINQVKKYCLTYEHLKERLG